METPKVILTSESVDEILWCDHSNKTSSAVLSHGTIYILGFYKDEIWDWSWILILGTLGSERVKLLKESGRKLVHDGTVSKTTNSPMLLTIMNRVHISKNLGKKLNIV